MLMRLASRVAAVAAAAGMASFMYQNVAEARDRRRFSPPGRLVDIGGRRLHLVEMGEGAPAVVIIPALGDNVLGWLPVAEGAAAETRVCVYDRAGIGWSDPPPRGYWTPGTVATDLHRLLSAAGIPAPSVVAGHSFGGIVARCFQAQHPDDVAGMLLIDSSHEQQGKRLRAADWRDGTVDALWRAVRRQARILGARRLAAGLGLLRNLDADIAREVLPEYAGAARAIYLSTWERRIVVRELLMMARTWEPPTPLGSLPLTVLTADRPSWSEWPVWKPMQDELAALSTDSEHIMARTDQHYIHRHEPDLVVTATRDLVRRCR
jgi:pimeloyl-ACP methyl ester carboxylesterase